MNGTEQTERRTAITAVRADVETIIKDFQEKVTTELQAYRLDQERARKFQAVETQQLLERFSASVFAGMADHGTRPKLGLFGRLRWVAGNAFEWTCWVLFGW